MVGRKFIPGSEWLYFKLYTGVKTADRLLAAYISKFVDDLKREGVVDKFFFIRYSDPGFHIRLRLHMSDKSGYTEVFSRFDSIFSECVNNSILSNIICDTYVREIERYGSETMELSETIFDIDSAAILSLLSDDDPTQPRWHQTLRLVDDMIDVFIPVLEDRYSFTLSMANSYKKEFNFESNVFTKQLNEKYRLARKGVEAFMSSPTNRVIGDRKTRLASIVNNLDSVISENSAVSKEDLLRSYVHMSVNRLFRSRGRLNEMVIYDFLNRHYNSALAREKYSTRKAV